MAADSYLRLINAAIGEAIGRSPSALRRSFAFACADLAIESLPETVAVGETAIHRQELKALQLRVRSSNGALEAEAVDRLLREQEDRLHAALASFRPNNTAAPYSDYVRLDTWRHAIRAIRATMAPDTTAAAGRAAFEAICTTREDNSVIRLASELLTTH